ncbi:MAG TPA: hypothetical protein VNT20_04900 [Flavisolibacter sp.]|nr:hypothetical protein [Flavisolibacter sp.]
MTVYFISGQAADETLFENLVLPSYINVHHVHWIEPLKKESLSNYCKRLLQQIDTSNDFVLVGVSLGGIVSVELNKIVQPKQTIIISSIATKKELRPLLKIVRSLRIHKIVPGIFYKWYSPILNWYFGTETEREKELLKRYTQSATSNYMKWAVNEILNWQNETRPGNLFHIHGTKDRIFPYRYSHPDILIKGGTHLMVHNRANEISRILVERLNRIS